MYLSTLSPEDGNIQFPKRCVSSEYEKMDEVKKFSNPDCNTPSSEPLRVEHLNI
jgi:hypothetical protein